MLSLFSLPARPGIGPMRRRRPPTTAEERRRRRASEEPGITRPTTTSWNASAATEGSSSTTRTSRRRPGRCTPTRSRPPWEDPSLGWDRMYFFIIFSPGIIVGGGGGGWWMRWNPLASSSHLVSCPLFICIPYRRDQSGRDQKYSNIFHRLGVGFETSAMHLLLQGLSGNWWERVGGANRSRAARKKKGEDRPVMLNWTNERSRDFSRVEDLFAFQTHSAIRFRLLPFHHILLMTIFPRKHFSFFFSFCKFLDKYEKKNEKLVWRKLADYSWCSAPCDRCLRSGVIESVTVPSIHESTKFDALKVLCERWKIIELSRLFLFCLSEGYLPEADVHRQRSVAFRRRARRTGRSLVCIFRPIEK